MTFPRQGVKRLSAAASLLLAGCAVRGPLFESEPGVEERILTLTLHSRPVRLHLATRRSEPKGAPLVLYVTGDGGWRGADPLVFRALVHWGYPAVGFEAGDYLDHLSDLPGTPTPRRVARDYERIIAHAEHTLGLPTSTPTLLVGFSRGAGLAVLAAGQRGLRNRLAGIVAVALTGEEEVLRHDEASGDTAAASAPLDPYAELPLVGSLPVVVIQSTNDHYVDAGTARRRFGPDGPTRRLVPIESDGHTFGGARDELIESLEAAVGWIAEHGPEAVR